MKIKIYTFALARERDIDVSHYATAGLRDEAIRAHCLSYYEAVYERRPMAEILVEEKRQCSLEELIGDYEQATDCSILRGEDEVEVPVLDAVADHLHSIVKEIEWSRHYPSNYSVKESACNHATEALNKLNSLKS